MSDQDLIDKLLYHANRAFQAGHNPMAIIGCLDVVKLSVLTQSVKPAASTTPNILHVPPPLLPIDKG